MAAQEINIAPVHLIIFIKRIDFFTIIFKYETLY